MGTILTVTAGVGHFAHGNTNPPYFTWEWIHPRGGHYTRSYDYQGQPSPLPLKDVLCQGFSEGVGVGLPTNDNIGYCFLVQFVWLYQLNYRMFI